MKTKFSFLNAILVVFILLTIMIIIYQYNHPITKIISNEDEIKSNNLISMMLEEELGSGKYRENTSQTFPSTGYHFNEQKSGCEQGSKIIFAEGKVKINAKGSDKCYVYFDRDPFTIEYDYSGAYETFIVPIDGVYKIELWGASGGFRSKTIADSGHGAYVKGNIKLEKDEELFIYVGEYPSYYSGNCLATNPNTAFNGIKIGSCTSGGGATDARLTEGEWDNFDSLKSRIMVAAGGGAASYEGSGGYGGELVGGDGEGTGQYPDIVPYAGKGGTQKSLASTFGVAEKNTCSSGNGYYAGQGGYGGNAGGGSSFISGYPGCDAIAENSTKTNIIHTGEPYHYSGKVFTDFEMLAGNKTMPSPDGQTEIGHEGNGYAKITLVK